MTAGGTSRPHSKRRFWAYWHYGKNARSSARELYAENQTSPSATKRELSQLNEGKISVPQISTGLAADSGTKTEVSREFAHAERHFQALLMTRNAKPQVRFSYP